MKFEVGDLVMFKTMTMVDHMIILKVSRDRALGEERSYLVYMPSTGMRRWVTSGLIRQLDRAFGTEKNRDIS